MIHPLLATSVVILILFVGFLLIYKVIELIERDLEAARNETNPESNKSP